MKARGRLKAATNWERERVSYARRFLKLGPKCHTPVLSESSSVERAQTARRFVGCQWRSTQGRESIRILAEIRKVENSLVAKNLLLEIGMEL